MIIEETFPILYKYDSNSLLRQWYMELGHKPESDLYYHRSVYGRVNGKHHTTEWTVVEPKNIGKANETTPWIQAGSGNRRITG